MAEKNMKVEVIRTTVTFAVGIGLIVLFSYLSGWIGGGSDDDALAAGHVGATAQQTPPAPITFPIMKLPTIGMTAADLQTYWGEPRDVAAIDATAEGAPVHERRTYQRSYGLIDVVLHQDAVVSVAISPREETPGFDPRDTPESILAKIAGTQTWTALASPDGDYGRANADKSLLASTSATRVAVARAAYVHR